MRFESDSAQLIKTIDRKEPTLELYGIVSDILALLIEFDVVAFVWNSRLQNVAADGVAKNALRLYEQQVVGVELIPLPN